MAQKRADEQFPADVFAPPQGGPPPHPPAMHAPEALRGALRQNLDRVPAGLHEQLGRLQGLMPGAAPAAQLAMGGARHGLAALDAGRPPTPPETAAGGGLTGLMRGGLLSGGGQAAPEPPAGGGEAGGRSVGQWAMDNALPLGLGVGGLYALYHYLSSRDDEEEERRRRHPKYAAGKTAGIGDVVKRIGGAMTKPRAANGIAGKALGAAAIPAGFAGGSYLANQARDYFTARGDLAGQEGRGRVLDTALAASNAKPEMAAALGPHAPAPPPDEAGGGIMGMLGQAGNWLKDPWHSVPLGVGAVGLMSLLNRRDDDDDDKEAAAGPPPGLYAFFTRRMSSAPPR